MTFKFRMKVYFSNISTNFSISVMFLGFILCGILIIMVSISLQITGRVPSGGRMFLSCLTNSKLWPLLQLVMDQHVCFGQMLGMDHL